MLDVPLYSSADRLREDLHTLLNRVKMARIAAAMSEGLVDRMDIAGEILDHVESELTRLEDA